MSELREKESGPVESVPPPHYQGTHYQGSAYGSAYAGAYGAHARGPLGELSLRRFIRLLREQWPLFTVMLLLCLAGTWLYVRRLPSTYAATADMEMSVRPPRYVESQAVYDDSSTTWRTQELLNTRLRRLSGSEMRIRSQAAFEQLLSESTHRLRRTPPRIPAATFKLEPDTFVLRISARYTDAEVVAMAVNAYASAAQQLSHDENAAASETAVAWLVSQKEVVSLTLAAAEEAVVAFRGESKLSALEGERRTVAAAIGVMAEDLSLLDGGLVKDAGTAEFLFGELERAVNDGEGLARQVLSQLPEGVPGATRVRDQIDAYEEMQEERAELLQRYTERHPTLVKLNASMATQREEINALLRESEAIVRNEVALAERQIEELRRRLGKDGERAVALDLMIAQRNARLSTLQRSVEAADIAYRGVLRRIEEARLSADANAATIKLSEAAQVPAAPVWPNRGRSMMIALLLGSVLGGVVMLLADVIRDRVCSASELERMTGLSVLASVPSAPAGVPRSLLGRMLLVRPNSLVSEAYATLRAHLDSPAYQSYSRVVLVTSSASGEGKTITAANLAIAFAQSGRRTLLIDFDLRRPQVGRLFEIPHACRRLIEYLSSDEPFLHAELTTGTPCPGLAVIATESVSAISPSSLLGTRRVDELLAWASEHFEHVVIDTPPHGIIADAAALTSLSSGVLFVVRAGQSRLHAVQTAVQKLAELGADLVGAVVNDVPMRDLDAYSASYYYSGLRPTRSAGQVINGVTGGLYRRLRPRRDEDEDEVSEEVG